MSPSLGHLADLAKDSLLETISSAPTEERAGWEGRMAATELITWRGMMTRIMAAGYETANSDGWEMNAMSLDGTLYLEDAASPKHESESTPERKRQTYYGYAYESVCTSAPAEERAPYDPPLDPVDTDVQWCAVVKANLGGVRMILGGEVDCVEEGTLKDPAHVVSPADFVELKTQLELAEAKDRHKFERYKMLKFYIQSCPYIPVRRSGRG